MIFAALLVASTSALSGPIVLTGATGQTGHQIYSLMKSKGLDVRAFVRNATKAKDLLKCTKCDESEGIFEGDITKPDTMKAVMSGAAALIIATSAVPHLTKDGKLLPFAKGAEPVDIDWNGAKNQLAAFAERQSPSSGLGHISLISTMGTETPEDPKAKYFLDYISFYKLNFEAALMASDIPFTIVKPCGLDYSGTVPGKFELVTGHDGDNKPTPSAIARADVARVMVASIEDAANSAGLRFDLCSKVGTPTTDADLPKVLQSARYPWDLPTPVVV